MFQGRKLTIWGICAFVMAAITFLVVGYFTALYPTGATRPQWVEVLKGFLTGICILPWCLIFLFPPLQSRNELPMTRMLYLARRSVSFLIGIILLVFALYLIVGSAGYLFTHLHW